MEKSVEDFIVISIFLGVVTAIFWLFVKLVSFIWQSIFYETPRAQYQVSAPAPYINNLYEYESITPKQKRVIAIDTEMVGGGERGSISMLARVSMVALDGFVYDKYVKPLQRVTDYRTPYSGICPEDLLYAENYYSVISEVHDILDKCIVVGHDVMYDLRILRCKHPEQDIWDSAQCKPFRKRLANRYLSLELWRHRSTMSRADAFEDTLVYVRAQPQISKIMNEKPSLKRLANEILGRDIQVTKHSFLEDARAALDLYVKFLDL